MIDRIGLAFANAGNLEVWYVTFVDHPGMYEVRTRATGIKGKYQLVLAQSGDRVRVAIHKGRIQSFENLDLNG